MKKPGQRGHLFKRYGFLSYQKMKPTVPAYLIASSEAAIIEL